MKRLYFLLVLILVFLIYNCSQPSDFDPADLQGRWEETFDWVSPWSGAILQAPSGEFAVQRTSTITFFEDSLLVTILPEAPGWALPDSTDADGNYVDEAGFTFSSAVQYKGSYTVTDDCISVLLEGKTKPLEFGFSIKKDELTLTALGVKDTTESIGHPNFSFVWDYGMLKSIGTFKMNNE